jgi:glycosyltransferase involved in cell wall biosynthesis
MSANPAVSVLMPVRNGERFIAEAIESILSQTLEDLELIILDDGSTDSTPKILEDLARRDDRIAIHRKSPGRNLSETLNLGASLAKAPLLARLDADDLALPDRLELQLRFLDEHPQVTLLGGQALLIDENGREFGEAHYPLDDEALHEALLTTNPFVHSAVVMRRDVFEEVGGYREIFVHSEDLDLWLRIAEGRKLANLPETLVKYRLHGNQQTLRKQEDQAIHSAAARASAQARAGGGPDPFEVDAKIDEELLLAHGVSREEITASVVSSASWLGRTTGRAGYRDAERRLFEAAYEKARSESGSAALVASVHRSMARRHAEQGQRLRAKLKAAQARLAERNWRG